MKREATGQQKMFAVYMIDKGLEKQRIYKRLEIKKQKTHNPGEN